MTVEPERPSPGDRRPIAARDTAWAGRVAAALADAGVSPDAISAASMAFAAVGAASFGSVAAGYPVAGLLGAVLGMQGRLLCNLFDGMVAVEGGARGGAGPRPTGELWNDLPDRVSDSLLLVAAGVASGRPGLGTLAVVLALHVAYVRVLGKAIGARSHFLGPMAKQHRMALLTGACLVGVPASAVGAADDVLAGALGLVCLGCVVTVVRRLVAIRGDLSAGVRP